MNNPNSPTNKIKASLKERWSAPDHPGAEPRFQVLLFAKDVAIFVFLPALAVFMFKSCDNSNLTEGKTKPKRQAREEITDNSMRSQIIDFTGSSKGKAQSFGISKRAPGTLTKIKLLNQVETYSNAPVHAIVIDNSLGPNLRGATLIGDASPDATFERINITFNLLKHPTNRSVAVPIAARALSLSGTLGVNARKKEGFFARAALGGAKSGIANMQGNDESKQSLKDALLKIFASGLLQESNNSATIEQNRANVLVLDSSQIFYAELTDYFPGER